MNRFLVVVLGFVVLPGLSMANDVNENLTTVFIWGVENNRVIRVAVLHTDPANGLITRAETYDNCSTSLKYPEQATESCRLRSTLSLVDASPAVRVYRIDHRNETERITFRQFPSRTVVTNSRLSYTQDIIFSDQRVSYSVESTEGRRFELGVFIDSIEVRTPHGITRFMFEDGERYRGSTLQAGMTVLEAQVDIQPAGSFLVEMPPYGDPGEFSHRIEVWTDKPSRGTLRSAAINSYLLPAGTFDFIFPFFAPTPQEVFEQAAAGE